MISPEQYAVLSVVRSTPLTQRQVCETVFAKYNQWLNSRTVIAASITFLKEARLLIPVSGELQITKTGLASIAEFEGFIKESANCNPINSGHAQEPQVEMS